MTSESDAKLRRYRCPKGHEIVLHGAWMALSIVGEGGKTATYQYCVHCFGEWARDQFPFEEVK